jgi:hypothetical protein
MKMSKITLGFLLLFVSCTNEKQPSQRISPPVEITPFEFSVIDYNYSLAYNIRYILTEKALMILYGDEFERDEGRFTLIEKRNNVLLDAILSPAEDLLKLSQINIDILKASYSNDCVKDGMQSGVKFKKGSKEKRVKISNYHQPEIGHAIEIINNIVPKEYRIHYDKKSLIEMMERCK